jgi:hypothetical protein
MHFADANLKSFDPKAANKEKLDAFNQLIAGGYKDQKTGDMITFPNWQGIQNYEEAMAAMDANPNLRKWFNSRSKVPKWTENTGLQRGQDVQWAITEPEIRNKEVNLVGMMNGEMIPYKPVDQRGFSHNTYDSTIYGTTIGGDQSLVPFSIAFPDATKYILKTQRPQDFTGTIQKVFPHQVIDDQYINQYGQYMDRIKGLTGRAEGGALHKAEGGAVEGYDDGGEVELPTGGLSTDIGTNPLSIYNRRDPTLFYSKDKHDHSDGTSLGLNNYLNIAKSLGNDFVDQLGSEYNNFKADPLRYATNTINRGVIADTLGSVADMSNMAMRPVDALANQAAKNLNIPKETQWYSDKPVLGADWFRHKMNEAGFTSGEENPISELASNFLSPAALVKGAIVAPEKLAKAGTKLAEKGLSMYETGMDPLSRVSNRFTGQQGNPFANQIFMGVKAKNADRVGLEEAKARVAAGEEPATVWKETGWGAPPYAPNDWRFEVSDRQISSDVGSKINQKMDERIQKLSDYRNAISIKKLVDQGMPFEEASVKGVEIADTGRPVGKNVFDMAKDNKHWLDYDTKFNNLRSKSSEAYAKQQGDLGNIIEHPELFENYPSFAKGIQFKTMNAKDSRNAYGSFAPRKGELEVSPKLLAGRISSGRPLGGYSTLAHEIQHAIQGREWWNPGGNPSDVQKFPQFYDPATVKAMQNMKTMLSNTDATTELGKLEQKRQMRGGLSGADAVNYNSLLKQTPEAQAIEAAKQAWKTNGTPSERYRRLGGEAEARLTQHRLLMTPEERRSQYPYAPEHFKEATGYDINDIIANPHNFHDQFKSGGMAFADDLDSMRHELLKAK